MEQMEQLLVPLTAQTTSVIRADPIRGGLIIKACSACSAEQGPPQKGPPQEDR